MDSIKALVLGYWPVVGTAISLITAALTIWLKWDSFCYWRMKIRWGLPLIGKIARAKHGNQTINADGWFQLENQLCSDFERQYISFDKDPDFYTNCSDYLNKVEEIDRTEKGIFMWGLVITLIFVEAIGFAYVLSNFASINTTNNEKTMLSWLVAFMISVAAAVLVELAGREWQRNSLISDARQRHRNKQNELGAGRGLNFESDQDILLERSFADNNSPKYIQILNRLKTNAKKTPSYRWTIIALIWITAMAIGAYLVRSYAYDSYRAEAVNQAAVVASPMDAMKMMGSSNDDVQLPKEMSDVNKTANDQAKSEADKDKDIASKITFGMLSILYVMIQLIGFYFGYAFSFVGKQSRKAHIYTRDFNNAQELINWMETKRHIVQSEADSFLQRLQSSLGHRATTSAVESQAIATSTQRSFAEYMKKTIRANLELKAANAQRQAATTNQAVTANVATIETNAKMESAFSPNNDAETINPVTTMPTQISPTKNLGKQQLPDDMANIDIAQLNDEEIELIADSHGVDGEWLKQQRSSLKSKQLPPEFADVDLAQLDLDEITVLAEEHALDLVWLKKQHTLAKIKSKTKGAAHA